MLTFRQFVEARPLYDPEPEIANLSGWITPANELITLGDEDWVVTHANWIIDNVLPELTDEEIKEYGEHDLDVFAHDWAYRNGYVKIVHDDNNMLYYYPRPTIRQFRELKDLAIEHGATLEYDAGH